MFMWFVNIIIVFLLNTKGYFIPLYKIVVLAWFLHYWVVTVQLVLADYRNTSPLFGFSLISFEKPFSQALLCRNIN